MHIGEKHLIFGSRGVVVQLYAIKKFSECEGDVDALEDTYKRDDIFREYVMGYRKEWVFAMGGLDGVLGLMNGSNEDG